MKEGDVVFCLKGYKFYNLNENSFYTVIKASHDGLFVMVDGQDSFWFSAERFCKTGRAVTKEIEWI